MVFLNRLNEVPTISFAIHHIEHLHRAWIHIDVTENFHVARWDNCAANCVTLKTVWSGTWR